VILVRFVAFWNTAAPMLVTDSGMVYAVLLRGNAIIAVNVTLNNTPSVLANVVLDGSANMFCKALQLENTLEPIVATEAGIVILVKPQPKNALSPMLVTELGVSKVTLAKPVQLANANDPMLVTWLGIVMLVKFGIVFSSQSDIFVIPLPKTIDDTTLNPRIQFRLVKASGIMKLIIGQPENGAKPVLIMESGRVTLVKPHPWNA
jgi:hypothetical protein